MGERGASAKIARAKSEGEAAQRCGALRKTAGKIYEGTSNMQLNTIAKIVLGGK